MATTTPTALYWNGRALRGWSTRALAHVDMQRTVEGAIADVDARLASGELQLEAQARSDRLGVYTLGPVPEWMPLEPDPLELELDELAAPPSAPAAVPRALEHDDVECIACRELALDEGAHLVVDDLGRPHHPACPAMPAHRQLEQLEASLEDGHTPENEA